MQDLQAAPSDASWSASPPNAPVSASATPARPRTSPPRGAPAPVAALMPGVFAAARDGEFAAVDPALAERIGRGPAAFRTELERAWAA
ncbi:hypothetical protein [Streptomyces sp. SUK 48]|uniref:hypothetical protein n=1 Tax=Streptomyces sp. SUK 48 TaxID=2582831 RepID=UPI00129A4B41|nr:hypothetical protein [Streptomyces sp. SUK 48]